MKIAFNKAQVTDCDLRAMQQPNQPIEEVFKEVRRNVGKETNDAQAPWESTSLTGFFTFRQGR